MKLIILTFTTLLTFTGCFDAEQKPAALEIKKIATGFKFTEGPAYGSDGKLYFSDIPKNRIHTWSPEEGTKVFLEPSGKSNGLYFDSAGRLLLCQTGERQLSRLEKDGSLTVLADQYEGNRFNKTNDLWIHPNGMIYFTDPCYGKRDQMEMEIEGVYLLNPATKKVSRLIDDMVRPNGIIGTRDGKYLYVADHGGHKTCKFPILQDGNIGPAIWTIERGSDGMTLDEYGNLYLTDGTVAIYSSEGELISEIKLEEKPANVVFGGPENRTLWVTARTSIYALKMNVAGMYKP
ncbi:MAG: SMP-30/gluconolactonase/LRE family protein [Verrucomicrobiota bacterium]